MRLEHDPIYVPSKTQALSTDLSPPLADLSRAPAMDPHDRAMTALDRREGNRLAPGASYAQVLALPCNAKGAGCDRHQ